MKVDNIQRWFSISVSFLLLFTAAVKIVSIIQNKEFLNLPNGVFDYLSNKAVMLIAVALELSAGIFVFFKRKSIVSLVASFWVVGIFTAYRLLARALFAKEPCHCLGGVFDWSGLSPKALNAIPIIMLIYIGLGGIVFLMIGLKNTPAHISPRK